MPSRSESSIKQGKIKCDSGAPTAFESPEQPLDLVAKLAGFPVILPFAFGGTAGVIPMSRTSWRVLSPSQARSIASGAFATGLSQLSGRARPSGASWACPSDRRKIIACRSLAETMWIFAYHPPRDLPMLCGPFVFRAPVPSGCTSALVLSRPKQFASLPGACSSRSAANSRSSTPLRDQRRNRA